MARCAGRHGGRRDCRRYRHRSDRARSCARSAHGDCHSRHPVAGRRTPSSPRRRGGRGAGRAVRRCQQLREVLRAPGRSLAATEPGGVVWANEFDNTVNRDIDAATTAEEIWADTGGKVDGFVAAVGTGGTLGGVSRGLKAKREGIAIALADPPGSALYSFFTTGEMKPEGSSVTEGIGQSRITKNLEGASIDVAFESPTTNRCPSSLPSPARRACASAPSSGVNVAGALRLARQLGPGHTIVTILCDSGTRYQSRLFNPAFLEAKSLPAPAWLTRPGRDCRRCSAPLRRLARDRSPPTLRGSRLLPMSLRARLTSG